MPDSVSAKAPVNATAVAVKPARRRNDARREGSGVGSSTVISVVPLNKVGVSFGVLARGKRHAHDEPARGAGMELDRAAVGLRHGTDDREPEAHAVAAGTAVEALEGLEQRRNGRGRHDLAGVAHLDGAAAGDAPGAALTQPAVAVVADGVLDEVRDEPVEQPAVAADRGGLEGRVDFEPAGGRLGGGLRD